MARTTATNFSGGLQFPYATAATDVFKKEDLQTLAQAVDQHDHTAGKGVAVNTAPAAGSITNAMLGADVARGNLLTNGGLEIWSRGLGPFSNTFAADRWLLSPGAGSTMSGTRIAGNGGGFALQVVYTHSTASGVSQDIQANENPVLPGKVVSFSADVNASVAGAAQLKILTNGAGAINVVSSFHPGGSTWQRLTVTATTNAATTDVQVSLALSASGTFQFDNAMLVVGSQPANYAPLTPADDLARCLRYYTLYNTIGGNQILGVGHASAATNAYVPWRFPVVMAVIPTITVSSPGHFQLLNGSVTPTSLTAAVSPYGGHLAVGVASGLVAGNAVSLQGNNAAANIVAESNP
jgi:hypothetical protein